MATDGERHSQSPPRNRLKFLCSYGGKILPRPLDGQLKYVGGETRLVAVPRTISFSELMKKLCSLFEDEVVLKYQLFPEELDALVSVTCDEDFHHMIDEYDSHDNKVRSLPDSSRLRAFCFPRAQVLFDDNVSTIDPTALEQRYIEAVNGVSRSPSTTCSNSSYHPAVTLSSGGSSPKFSSNEKAFPAGGDNNSCMGFEQASVYNALGEVASDQCSFHRNINRVRELQRVQSSPNLLNYGGNHCHHHHHHYMQHHYQYHHQPSSRLGRLAPPPIITGASEVGRFPQDQVQLRRYSPTGRHHVNCSGCGHSLEVSSPVSDRYGSGGAPDGLVQHPVPPRN